MEHWRERVASIATMEDLCILVAEAVSVQIPAVKEVQQEPPNSLSVVWAQRAATPCKVVLDNLWAGLQGAPAPERVERIEALLESIRLPFDTGLEDRTVERLIPIIRHVSYVDQVPELRSISRCLAGDIWVAYAFDFPAATASALPLDLERLGLTLEEFQAAALANLRRRLQPRARPITLGRFRVEAVRADGNNESGVLLFDEFWKAVRKRSRGDILAAVPARNILVYVDGAESWALQALRMVAEKAEASSPYNISCQVLKRHEMSWIPI